ncbi:MAG: hypothetical protein EOO27_06360 [Comamonadaceae bacterium]|nr:MAG: hypothetical protein EOO27_06360 [Comamonadaceae bacterium]
MGSLNDTDVNSNDESRATWFVHDRNGLRWDDPDDYVPLAVQHMARRAEDPTFGTGDEVRIRKPRNADEARYTEAPDTQGAPMSTASFEQRIQEHMAVIDQIIRDTLTAAYPIVNRASTGLRRPPRTWVTPNGHIAIEGGKKPLHYFAYREHFTDQQGAYSLSVPPREDRIGWWTP